MVATILGGCYWLYATAPEKGYGVSLKSQHDDLLDILGMTPKIAGNVTEGVGNGTAQTNATSGGGGGAGSTENSTADSSGENLDPRASASQDL